MTWDRRLRRLVVGVATVLVAVGGTPPALNAQRANVSPLDSARASVRSDSASASIPLKEKDPATATLLGFFPGVGHLYAEELNRGWLIILVYSIGAGISMSGRTDTVGKVGGVMAIGGYLFSVFDSGKAAHRYNKRLAKLKEAAPSGTAEKSPAAHPVCRRIDHETPALIP